MADRVLTSIVDGVAHVRLNRAEKRNALDVAMFEALIAAGEALCAETAVRAVVLSGEGKAFCAGLDFQSFMMTPDGKNRLLDRPEGQVANVAQRAAWIWQEVPVPVIAAVHGAAFGGGCQIALAADFRYLAPDAQMSVMEIKWGLIPDMSITQTLLRNVRLDLAKELVFTGRIVSADEAVDIGLATRVTEDPIKAALATAALIASKSPDAIRGGKRLMRDTATLDAKESFLLETEIQIPLLGSANQMEAVQANMTKRDPEFVDPD